MAALSLADPTWPIEPTIGHPESDWRIGVVVGWSCLGLVDTGFSGDCGDVLVVGGAVVVEAALDALGVVEGLDVVEHVRRSAWIRSTRCPVWRPSGDGWVAAGGAQVMAGWSEVCPLLAAAGI